MLEEKFKNIKQETSFDSFWSAERKCNLDGGKTLVTFSYLSTGDKRLTHIFRGMHTLFVLFDQQDKPLAESDIACPFADDVGGISEMQVEGNYLYTECITQGSGGAMSGFGYGASEVHRVNLSSFKNELVWQEEWQNIDGNIQVLSNKYFVTKNEVPASIQARINMLSRR